MHVPFHHTSMLSENLAHFYWWLMDLCLHPNVETVAIVFFAWMVLAHLNMDCGDNLSTDDIIKILKKHQITCIESVYSLIEEMPKTSVKSLNEAILSMWQTTDESGTHVKEKPWEPFL